MPSLLTPDAPIISWNTYFVALDCFWAWLACFKQYNNTSARPLISSILSKLIFLHLYNGIILYLYCIVYCNCCIVLHVLHYAKTQVWTPGRWKNHKLCKDSPYSPGLISNIFSTWLNHSIMAPFYLPRCDRCPGILIAAVRTSGLVFLNE